MYEEYRKMKFSSYQRAEIGVGVDHYFGQNILIMGNVRYHLPRFFFVVLGYLTKLTRLMQNSPTPRRGARQWCLWCKNTAGVLA